MDEVEHKNHVKKPTRSEIPLEQVASALLPLLRAIGA